MSATVDVVRQLLFRTTRAQGNSKHPLDASSNRPRLGAKRTDILIRKPASQWSVLCSFKRLRDPYTREFHSIQSRVHLDLVTRSPVTVDSGTTIPLSVPVPLIHNNAASLSGNPPPAKHSILHLQQLAQRIQPHSCKAPTQQRQHFLLIVRV